MRTLFSVSRAHTYNSDLWIRRFWSGEPGEGVLLWFWACNYERASAACLVVDAADDGNGRAVLNSEFHGACEQAGDAGAFAGVLDSYFGSTVLLLGHHLADKVLDLKCGEQVVDGGVL